MEKSKWQEIKEYFQYWPSMGWDWRVRNFENLVDDPIDDVKHKLHGISIFGKKFYLPSWLMKGSGKEGK